MPIGRRSTTITAILTFLLGGQLVLLAADHQGHVRFGGVPVQGAAVQATQGDRTVRTLTDHEGRYVLPDVEDGTWTIQVEMPGFEPVRRDMVVTFDAAPAEWDLRMLPLEEMRGRPASGFPKVDPAAPADPATVTTNAVVDGLLINGSVINGAATELGLQRAFGNNRQARRSPYRGQASLSGGSSLFDSRPFSVTGLDVRQPSYGRANAGFTIGGPLQIPGLFRMGTFTALYNRTQSSTASIATGRVLTDTERAGDFSASLLQPVDPETGLPFPGGVLPQDRLSPQALALLNLYPRPNIDGGPFNYQIPIPGTAHGDGAQVAINNIRINQEQLSGTFAFQRSQLESVNLFGFTDSTRSSSISASLNWQHRFTPRISSVARYEFRRGVAESIPYFSGREDISGAAGISGNDRDPRNWGPPALFFSSGIASLAGGTFADDRTYSNRASYTTKFILGRHVLDAGGDYTRQRFDLFSQRDARGSFTFTGAQTGNDVADFLLGIPSASSIAFGNPDKYFRQPLASLFVTDDFRATPSLTLTIGVRWEYEAPITERFGRLVNLDIASGFSTATPVVAGTAGESLIRPDRGGIQPRLGVAFRPSYTSSMVIRAGYGLYRETSVYRAIADQMAQQSPLSKSLSVQNSPENPLTLADGFRGSPAVTATTFAIDPLFRVGSAHNWTASVQHDLPASMQATVTYLGILGTHIPQRIVPNTYPAGAENPCPGCPVGFVYLSSNGTSRRHGLTFDLRRRQRNGFEAAASYTFAKAEDDAGLGGYLIAQNWLDPGAEWGPSNFDRRHQLTAQAQFTSGFLARGGMFSGNWREKLFAQWTMSAQLTVGSGTPLSPVLLAPIRGTGITGSLRPDATGLPINIDVDGRYVNPSAFAAPTAGQWGNAGRNSIRGPRQFELNASFGRSFRFNQRTSLDFRLDATNLLNRVTYPDWNTLVGSTQFGLPTRANGMRTLQPSIRLNF
jgi:trimeric autotransporter adhesin